MLAASSSEKSSSMIALRPSCSICCMCKNAVPSTTVMLTATSSRVASVLPYYDMRRSLPWYSGRVVNARSTLVIGHAAPAGSPPAEWCVSGAPVAYEEAVATMERRAAEIAARQARELVWLLEHPPLYTAGTSANPADMIKTRFPVYQSGRGGQMTYHGP